VLKPNQTLLFVGDSITDCGRARPVGFRGSLGEGYVAFVDALLGAFRTDLNTRVLNTGIGGNRVTDLAARWEGDVKALQPDVLSVMIGINDVWRQFDSTTDLSPVTPAVYEDTYRRILADVRPQLKGLVLMTPYFLEANKRDPMRAMMDRYGRLVAKLAREFDARFVDTQAAFDNYLSRMPTQTLCGDRVHPNRIGHLILAHAFLDGIGVKLRYDVRPSR